MGADGRPVTVALFDQDGTPLDTQSGYEALVCPEDASPLPIPYRDASGQILTNVYPVRAVCVDANGATVEPLATGLTSLPKTNWATLTAPLVGQHVELDANGNFSGVLVSAPSPSPTKPGTTPSASATNEFASPTPSKR